jgi:hypothetical protein
MVKPGGTHLLADFYGVSASKLTCCEEIEDIFNNTDLMDIDKEELKDYLRDSQPGEQDI